ncbi:hypothetical protein ACWGH4_00280 [Streptomyces sp. NPDC054847]
MDIGHELALIKRKIEEIERSSRLSSASLDDAALEVFDDTGSLKAIVGVQADGTSGVNVVNGPVPPTPSDPTVEPALAALTVAWDGTFTDAQAAPLDWMRVEVHVGPTAGFTPDQGTLRDTIETAQGGSVVISLPYTEWHVKLRSRSTAGVAGPASNGVAGTPRKADTEDLVVGAITADLISVDALTGKTITGGTINGAEIHSDDGAGATVDIQDGMVVASAPSGWSILLDPIGTKPAVGFNNSLGVTAGYIAATGTDSQPAVNIVTGQITDGAVSDWRWRTYSGQGEGSNFWRTYRTRDSDGKVKGGWIEASPTRAFLAFVNTVDALPSTRIEATDGVISVSGGRLSVQPAASASSGVLLNAAAGHTGNLLRLQLNAADKFTVDKDGNTTLTGTLTGPNGTFSEEGAWQAVTFTDWKQSTNGTYQTLRCSRGTKRARLDGAAMVATAMAAGTSQNVCTLPAGMWPLKAHYYDVPFATGGSPSLLGCRVGADGVVTVWTTAARAVNDLFDFTECSWPLD